MKFMLFVWHHLSEEKGKKNKKKK